MFYIMYVSISKYPGTECDRVANILTFVLRKEKFFLNTLDI